MKKEVIGVDIGGTNVRVARMNDKLEILAKETVRTADFTSKEEFFNQIQTMIKKVDPEHQVDALGIVFPAPWTSRKSRITDMTNIPYLENMEIKEIQEHFPEYTVYLENDVNVIALLESDKGASRDARHSVYITVSTGIGSGVIIDKKIYHGANGYAGEIGSIIISEQNQGTLEGLCSGKALENESKRLFGQKSTAKKFFASYEEGEERSIEVFNGWKEGLARGIAAVVQMLNPEIIVLGGPVILNHGWLIEELKEEICKNVMGELADAIILKEAEFGTDAGIIGAGYYALKQAC